MTLSAILRKSPFARFLASYMAGILSVSLLGITFSYSGAITAYLVSVLFCFLLFLAIRTPGYFTNQMSGIFSGIILFIAGFLNMNMHIEYGNQVKKTAGFKGYVLMEVIEPPEYLAKVTVATAVIKSRCENHTWIYDKQKIQVSFERDTLNRTPAMGMQLLASIRLQGINPPTNPHEFDYRRYLEGRHIYNRAYLPSDSWKAISYGTGFSPRAIAHHMQQQLLETYQKIGLNHTLYGLLSAITLGYKNDLEARTKQVFSQAGVMHVMALSGFNVAIIALVIGYLLSFANRISLGRIFKTAIIIIVIWVFAFITGLSPSVIRASVMITFMLTGQLIQRRVNTYNILFLSAFLLLVQSPAMIADVSFQLSFAAVLGMLMFYQPLYSLLTCRNFLTNKLWQLFSVSCAAQLSTLPLTIYYFHQFPVYFWLTNIYVVPLVSLIICVSGIYLACSALVPLMTLTGSVLSFLVSLLYKSVVFTEMLPFSLIENIYINEFQTWLLVFMIIIAGFYMVQRKIKMLLFVLALLVVFQVITMRHITEVNNQQLILVGNVRRISTVNLISGRNCLMLCDSVIPQNHNGIRYAFNNLWIAHGVSGKVNTATCSQKGLGVSEKMLREFGFQQQIGSNLFFSFAGKRVAILNDDSLYKKSADKPMAIDLLIVNGQVSPKLYSLERLLKPQVIVLGSSVNAYQARRWLEAGEKSGSAVWYVADRGAFLLVCR